MITYVYIPTVNITDDFEYNGVINQNDYIKMLNDNYYESSDDIDNFMNNKNFTRKKYNYFNDSVTNKEYFIYNKVNCTITNMYDESIDENEILKLLNNGEMFILILNIDPNSLTDDIESEIIFWINDSMKINKNKTINDDLKLLSLPKRNLKIDIDQNNLTLVNCKILDDYSEIKNSKFKFAILIEKIIK